MSAPAPHSVSELKPGWSAPESAPLPQPTLWPLVLAGGVTLLLWGILTSWLVGGTGAILTFLALRGWAGILLNKTAKETQHE